MSISYGFFSSSHPAALASQHNRLATLSAAPYAILAGSSKKPPKTSARIPTPPSDEPPRRLAHRSSSSSLLPTLSTADMELETKRIDKWADMLVPSTRDAGGNVMEWTVAQGWWDGRRDGTGKYRKLQRRVFKGVPDRWRRAVWGLELEKMAEEAPGRGRVQSLEALQAEYQVRGRLLSSVARRRLLIPTRPRRSFSQPHRAKTYRSTSMFRGPFRGTSCFTHGTAPASARSSTSSTPLASTATTLAGTAKAWDRSLRPCCVTLNPRCVAKGPSAQPYLS